MDKAKTWSLLRERTQQTQLLREKRSLDVHPFGVSCQAQTSSERGTRAVSSELGRVIAVPLNGYSPPGKMELPSTRLTAGHRNQGLSASAAGTRSRRCVRRLCLRVGGRSSTEPHLGACGSAEDGAEVEMGFRS